MPCTKLKVSLFGCGISLRPIQNRIFLYFTFSLSSLRQKIFLLLFSPPHVYENRYKDFPFSLFFGVEKGTGEGKRSTGSLSQHHSIKFTKSFLSNNSFLLKVKGISATIGFGFRKTPAENRKGIELVFRVNRIGF